METLAWRNQMELGYPPLDDEHKLFLDVVNESVHIAQNRNINQMDAVFEKCYEYARTHFPHEEDVMERISFPDLQSHMDSHQLFIKNISELRQLFHSAKTTDEKEQIVVKTANFLNVWFLGHILSRDKVYKPYLVRLRNLPPRMDYNS